MRCFVAVSISAEIKDAMATAVDELRRAAADAGTRVSWTRPEGWHVTLKFLGEISAERVEAVRGTVASAVRDMRAFTVSMGRMMTLPRKSAPRVVAVGVSDGGELGRIAQTIDHVLEPLGFERERRRFTPHLTVGRIRSSTGARELAEAVDSLDRHGFGKEEMTRLGLYSSELGRGGARYTLVECFTLDSRTVNRM